MRRTFAASRAATATLAPPSSSATTAARAELPVPRTSARVRPRSTPSSASTRVRPSMSVQSPSTLPGRGSTVLADSARCARGASNVQRFAASAFHGIVTAKPPAGRPISSRQLSPAGRRRSSSSEAWLTSSGTNSAAGPSRGRRRRACAATATRRPVCRALRTSGAAVPKGARSARSAPPACTGRAPRPATHPMPRKPAGRRTAGRAAAWHALPRRWRRPRRDGLRELRGRARAPDAGPPARRPAWRRPERASRIGPPTRAAQRRDPRDRPALRWENAWKGRLSRAERPRREAPGPAPASRSQNAAGSDAVFTKKGRRARDHRDPRRPPRGSVGDDRRERQAADRAGADRRLAASRSARNSTRSRRRAGGAAPPPDPVGHRSIGGDDLHELEPPRRVRGGQVRFHLGSPLEPGGQAGVTPRLPPHRPAPVLAMTRDAKVPHDRDAIAPGRTVSTPGAVWLSSTACRPLACPSSEAAFGPCSTPRSWAPTMSSGGLGAKTAQRVEADGAGACGPRAGVPRWGVDAPERSEGDSEGPHRGTPSSVARADASEGGARCAARVTRP